MNAVGSMAAVTRFSLAHPPVDQVASAANGCTFAP